ncbi:MAG: thymidine phosphorylase [Candidatus Neomarinimicrobiota bacterium]
MIPAEIIKIKRNGGSISKTDLKTFVDGFTAGKISDAQMSALFMAIYFSGMDNDEIFMLVKLMLDSGQKMDFSHLESYVADKHSTGGVGDKVSIILGPLLAAAGIAVPMISGRSLGHTGGTLDKLETIPGLTTEISLEKFRQQVDSIGISMIGQTQEICPADKKMYSLRNATGTVESIPLICGSIMSKKIAEGIQGLVLDVKIGSGAFMKTIKQGRELGELLKRIGEDFNIRTDIIYSNMDQPLGKTAGLWCEVAESIDALRGAGAPDLMELTFELGAKLLLQAGITSSRATAIAIQQDLISQGKAWDKFIEMAGAQKGKTAGLEKTSSFHIPRHEKLFYAHKSGFIQSMDTTRIGLALIELGAGRKNSSDNVDPTAGMVFFQKLGAEVKTGEPLIRCFNSNSRKLEIALNYLKPTFRIGSDKTAYSLIIVKK